MAITHKVSYSISIYVQPYDTVKLLFNSSSMPWDQTSILRAEHHWACLWDRGVDHLRDRLHATGPRRVNEPDLSSWPHLVAQLHSESMRWRWVVCKVCMYWACMCVHSSVSCIIFAVTVVEALITSSGSVAVDQDAGWMFYSDPALHYAGLYRSPIDHTLGSASVDQFLTGTIQKEIEW